MGILSELVNESVSDTQAIKKKESIRQGILSQIDSIQTIPAIPEFRRPLKDQISRPLTEDERLSIKINKARQQAYQVSPAVGKIGDILYDASKGLHNINQYLNAEARQKFFQVPGKTVKGVLHFLLSGGELSEKEISSEQLLKDIGIPEKWILSPVTQPETRQILAQKGLQSKKEKPVFFSRSVLGKMLDFGFEIAPWYVMPKIAEMIRTKKVAFTPEEIKDIYNTYKDSPDTATRDEVRKILTQTLKQIRDKGVDTVKREGITVSVKRFGKAVPSLSAKTVSQKADSLPLLSSKNETAKAIIKTTVETAQEQPAETIPLILSEKGGIKMPDFQNIEEASAQIAGSLKKVFTRFAGLDDITKQQFTMIGEIDNRLRSNAAKLGAEIYKVGITNRQIREQIARAGEQPEKYSLPAVPEAEEILTKVKKTQEKGFAVLEKIGVDPVNWPQSSINMLEEEKIKKTSELTKQIKKYNKLKRESAKRRSQQKINEIQQQIKEINNKINKLQGLEYIHRITKSPKRKTQIVKQFYSKRLTKKPIKIVGERLFPTREDVEKAGYVLADPAADIAEYIYEVNHSYLVNNIIQHINKNPALSTLKKRGFPQDWVKIDTSMFPSGNGRHYHPSIAEAIKEITYISDRNKSLLTKAYDKINLTGKFISFLNPAIMTKNDLEQAFRLGGFTGVYRHIPEAVKDVMNESELMLDAEKNGLFSTITDYHPPIEEIVNQITSVAEKTRGQRFAEEVERIINPLEISKNIRRFNDKTTWTWDRVLRMAGLRFAMNNPRFKDLPFSKIVDEINTRFGAYNSIPRRTNAILNRVGFTLNYKLNMMKSLKKIWSSPKRYWPELLRHYTYKVFLKRMMPWIIGSGLLWKEYKGKKVVSERGYKLVIKNVPVWDKRKNQYIKKDKVYSFSGPLLEETKFLHRPIAQTIQFNLAFIPQAINRFLSGPKYAKTKREAIGEFFKIGIPIERELKIWASKDLETFDKFMSTVGIAYVYYRKSRPTVKDHANFITSVLTLLDLWTDFKTRFGTEIKQQIFGKKETKKKKAVDIFKKIKPIDKPILLKKLRP